MPSEEEEWVIRIPRSDNASEFVLVHVAPTGKSGKATLDLKFVATEGENPYVGSLRLSRLKDIRSKNYQGTDKELEQILKSVLKVENATRGSIQDTEFETTASIRQTKGGENELVISIRKRIDSITQRVATLTLQQNDDQTIELYEWMGLMLSRTEVFEHKISDLTNQLQAAEKSIKQLKSGLDDLVQSKKDHEKLLVTNFAHVLNEKKLKIRNQQRLLKAANIDPERLRELQSAIHHDPSQKSRDKKRKADTHEKGEEEISDSDDDFEKMDIDKSRSSRKGATEAEEEEEEAEDDEDLTDGSKAETPQPLEEETESEAEEERLATPSDDDDDQNQEEQQEGRPKRPNLAKSAEAPVPPKRDLPFLRRTKNIGSTEAESEKQDSQTRGREELDADEATGGETDDDEL